MKELFSALVKFSSLDIKVVKNKTNPHFKSKYADLEEIISKIKKPLADLGIGFSQNVRGKNTLITKVFHVSGESFEESYDFKEAQNMQGEGSAITYAKRYQLSAIFGLAADDDDDGNEAVKSQAKPQAQPVAQAAKPTLKDVLNACTSLEAVNSQAAKYYNANRWESVKDTFKPYFDKFEAVEITSQGIGYTKEQVYQMEHELQLQKEQQ